MALQLNPKVYLEIYQQLTDEIARAYGEMVEIKVRCSRILRLKPGTVAVQIKINLTRREGAQKEAAQKKINEL